MNWRLHGKFMPLEEGRIEGLLAASIAGVEKPSHVSGFTGFGAGLVPGLAAWARAAAASPWTYAASCAARARWMLEGQPLLFAAAAAGAWLGRARAEVRGLALLAVYYAGVHCLIAISEAYLVPLWPLLAALGGAGAAELLRRVRPGACAPRPEPARAVVLALLAPALAAAAWSLTLVVRYPARAAAAAETDAAEEEAWPLLDEARRLLARGDARGAGERYRRAAALRPGERRVAVGLAWTQALAGAPAPCSGSSRSRRATASCRPRRCPC
ncbi:MAG: hypothetical protein M0D55_08880 [Elusimicrobiota bacterium]|nr:MAG: hypothetical protein M0D55_08880 [Elusimicrobiota bacterium]